MNPTDLHQDRIKMSKVKQNSKISKKNINYKDLKRLSDDFFTETLQARREL